MKKYIHSLMAFIAIVSFVSCSSEDCETINNTGNTKVMMFTATQEGTGTRAAINPNDNTKIVWKTDDAISVFPQVGKITGGGGTNNKFELLPEGSGLTSGTFVGDGIISVKTYFAVYPYNKNIDWESPNMPQPDKLTNIVLPKEQTATAGTFDRNAALMIAKNDRTKFAFKNIVGFIKVKPLFDCAQIVLDAGNVNIAGVLDVDEELNSSISKNPSSTITLSGTIEANKEYYIAVYPTTITAGWTISFIKSNGKVFTRKGKKDLTITRSKVTNLGEFDLNAYYWYESGRGDVVNATQEVDLGLTITKGDLTYKVIFAKSNLTTKGLAEKEADFGDYFAWGATEPWYTSIDTTNPYSVTINGWKEGKTGGYIPENAPYRYRVIEETMEPYDKYTDPYDVLEAMDDAARQILGGDWQLPTREIWQALFEGTYTKEWISQDSYNGLRVTNASTNVSLFLPAAGYIYPETCYRNNSLAFYWSNTADNARSKHFAYSLCIESETKIHPQDTSHRYQGFSIRPVRLVPVAE